MTQYIEDLLYRYDCVVIPKFGAFLACRKSAEIDETHTFYPPKKVISFNRQLVDNDGLLTSYIAKAEHISYEQSLQLVVNFVEDLLTSLNSGTQVRIGQVGYFYTQGDKILFQPSLNQNYLLASFGTSSFSSPVISRVAEVEENLVAVTADKEEETPVIPLQTEKNNRSKTAFWRYAAVGLVAVGIGSLVATNWYADQVKAYNLAAQEQAERQIENKIQQATFVVKDPLPAHIFKINSLNRMKPAGNFHIVAGAFRDKNNALKKLNELKKEGYKAHYLGANKYGLHQVAFESFTNRRDATNALYSIQQNEESAWLLVEKE